MKKVVLIVGVALICLTGFLLLPFSKADSSATNTSYLRVHIRANSNSVEDQNIKYEIKKLVVEFLTPKLENVSTLEQAKDVVCENLDDISLVASEFLEQKGFHYSAQAKLNTEYFPTRSYEELVLTDGYYDALILNLGSGEGDNWWCVVYPPLCFNQNTNSDKVKYKSIIAEIIGGKNG